MAGAKLVGELFDLEASGFDQPPHRLEIEEAAVSVGHCREVETARVQPQLGGFVALPVPQGLKDLHLATGVYRDASLLEDVADLFFGEAVEELTHPHRIGPQGQALFGRQQIVLVEGDAGAQAFGF